MADKGSFLNPTIYNKKLFPSMERTLRGVRSVGSSIKSSVKSSANKLASSFGQLGFLTNPSFYVPSAIGSIRETVAQTPLINTRTRSPFGSNRDFSQQWDTKPVVRGTPAANSIQAWATSAPFRGTPETQNEIALRESYMAQQQPQIERALAGANTSAQFSALSPSSQGVVRAFGGAAGGINEQYTPSFSASSSRFPTSGFAPVSATQIGIGAPSQIAEINQPSFQSGSMMGMNIPKPTQQLPQITQTQYNPRTAISTPRGTLYATSQQQASFAARPTAYEGRSQQEQQELLAKIRQQGAGIRAKSTEYHESKIAERRANPATYTTKTGKTVAVPTNMYGEPIKSWKS